MIAGTVVASDTDEDGNAIAIDLETHDGTYPTDLVGVGADLLSYVGHTVEIEGRFTETDDGSLYLEVLSFTLIPKGMESPD